jgi:hypothetical protein
MMITNFDYFATEIMHWEQGSEEYISAFKSYNESLIEYNNKIGNEIKSEFDNVANAKIGDQIDLTRTLSLLGEEAEKLFIKDVESYGAILKNGILTITKDTNLASLAQRIGQFAVYQGGMFKGELEAEIAKLST